MPFQYARDDAKHRLRVTISDPLTVDDLISSVDHQLADGTWLYGLLVDARGVLAFAPKPSDLQPFLSRVRDLVAAHGPRGPVALVSKQSVVISGGHMYNVFGGKTESLEMFWDMDDARRFLDKAQTAAAIVSDSRS